MIPADSDNVVTFPIRARLAEPDDLADVIAHYRRMARATGRPEYHRLVARLVAQLENPQ